MAVLTRPEDIVCEFLRARLTDPRGRYTSENDSFTATASQTDFTLTPTTSYLVRAITSVTQNSVTLKKWEEYEIDLFSKKIILKTGATVSDAIVVNYYSSSSTNGEWIYPDKPIAPMSKTNFPRISIMIIDKTGERAGPYDASIIHQVHFQIDVWTKKDYSKTYSSKNYEEQDLADYLAHQVENQFIDYVDDLYPKLYDYSEVAFGQANFDEQAQSYRHKQEFLLSGTDVGH